MFLPALGIKPPGTEACSVPGGYCKNVITDHSSRRASIRTVFESV